MKTIIFVCHGNICRSVAAEYIFKMLMKNYQMEDRFKVFSRATSLEEIGNDIYPPMKHALNRNNIPFEKHYAKRITQEDYDKADLIFYMDDNNLRYLNYLLCDTKKKFHLVSKFTPSVSYIDDPWYSGEYEIVIREIWQCCEDIIKNLK